MVLQVVVVILCVCVSKNEAVASSVPSALCIKWHLGCHVASWCPFQTIFSLLWVKSKLQVHCETLTFYSSQTAHYLSKAVYWSDMSLDICSKTNKQIPTRTSGRHKHSLGSRHRWAYLVWVLGGFFVLVSKTPFGNRSGCLSVTILFPQSKKCKQKEWNSEGWSWEMQLCFWKQFRSILKRLGKSLCLPLCHIFPDVGFRYGITATQQLS